MKGMNRQTGQPLSGLDHVKQSIRDILQTPIGSRVMRRDYGSRIFSLIDAPLNGATLLELYGATAEALKQWEPRIDLSHISASRRSDGAVVLSLTGTYRPTGVDFSLTDIEV